MEPKQQIRVGMYHRSHEPLSIMNRAILLLAILICLVWALAFASVPSPAQAAPKSDAGFQQLWAVTKVTLTTKPKKTPAIAVKADDEPKNPRLRKRKRAGSSTSPDLLKGQDRQQSPRAVCRSQCSLERMSCDQGNNSFQNRADQLQAAQSSCFLAVQSCLSRC